MKSKWFVPGVIAGIVILIGASIGITYNGLVTSRETVNSSLANLDAQYQRRADLVPNLVSTVKGAANFEQSTLTAVVEARAKATQTTLDVSNLSSNQLQNFQAAQSELSTSLSRLLVSVEAYPEITATQNFQDLQSQLEGTENRITVARKDFNDVARAYNTSVQRFPKNVVANLFNFNTLPYFEANDKAKTAPTVNFE